MCASSNLSWNSGTTAPSILGVEGLAPEPLTKGIGVDRIRKAENLPPLIPMENGLSAWAERQVAAEVGMDLVIIAGASFLWERHLMRPPSIDEGRCQFAFAPGHGSTYARSRRKGQADRALYREPKAM